MPDNDNENDNENQPERAEHAEPAPAQQQPGRFQRAARHRATPIVAAALAGVLVGGGVMSLIAFTGDDHDDRDRDRDRIGMYRDDDGPGRFGPHDGPKWFRYHEGPESFGHSPGMQPRFPEMRERMRGLPVPDHRHDEDGKVIPPDDDSNGGSNEDGER